MLVDLDGTALDSRGQVTPATATAFERLQAAGWLVVVATGRGYRTSLPVAEQLRLRGPLVCMNGALVKHTVTHETLAATPIAPELVRRIVETVTACGQSLCLHYDTGGREDAHVLVQGPQVSPQTHRFAEVFGQPTRVVAAEDVGSVAEPALELSVWAEDEQLTACQAALASQMDSQLRTLLIYAPNVSLNVLEVFTSGVTKWEAARRLAASRGIGPEAVVAVGDDINDIEMVREAGLGVAMGNAAAALKAVADRVAPSNDESGLAAVIDELI